MGRSNKSGGKKTKINFRGSVYGRFLVRSLRKSGLEVLSEARNRIWLEGKNGDFNGRSGNKKLLFSFQRASYQTDHGLGR